MRSSPTYWPEFPVHVLVKGDVINGDLCVPRSAKGITVFAYGSNGRRSPDLKNIASAIHRAEIGSLGIDLLTDEENQNPDNQIDIPLLTERLLSVIHWLWSNEQTVGLPIGLFGAGVGATAVLKAASQLGEEIKAVVTRDACYDMVRHELHMVKAPTLLLVSSSGDSVIDLHDQAFHALCCPKKLEIIPGMNLGSDNEGVSGIVASLSTAWFRKHLPVVAEPATASLLRT